MQRIQQKGYYLSPIGCLEVGASDKGIRSVRRIEQTVTSTLPTPRIVQTCIAQLVAYFDKKRDTFDLTIDWEGYSAFNVRVWKALLQIPYGQTRSYSDIAHAIGNPSAVRAVGLANKNNPMAIIVPCHRVIGKNGELTGYFYGLDTKRRLLEHENPMSFARQGTLF